MAAATVFIVLMKRLDGEIVILRGAGSSAPDK
jgi:hypothetical protein